MPPFPNILLFVAAALALLLVPGPAVIYIVTRSVAQGRAAGLLSVLGIHTGTVVYVVAASLGLSALLNASSTAFLVVKYLGAAYLVWLGLQKLRPNKRGEESLSEPPQVSKLRIFGQAVLVALFNPKTIFFFAAFLPQFVDPAQGSVTFQMAFFSASFVVFGMTTDSTYALLASTLVGRLWRTAGARWRLDRSSGIIYLILGIFLAVIRAG